MKCKRLALTLLCAACGSDGGGGHVSASLQLQNGTPP